MKLFDVSQSVLDAVKNAMVESPACYGKAKGCTCKKCKPVKEEVDPIESEVLDERNKENKFKKDLHTAKQGIEHEKKNLGFEPKDLESMYVKYGHQVDGPTRKDSMKNLLKIYKRAGRKVAKEEVEQVDELKKSTLASYIGGASADKSALAHDIGKINQIAADTGTSAKDRAERDALSKKHGLRSLGINRAANKLAGTAKVNATEEIEAVEEGRDPGASWGASTPLRKKGVAVSDNGNHVAKIKRDVDNNEWRVELHSFGKHYEPADYFTDDKEDAHSTAKAMVAHAQKHEKPQKAPKATSIGSGSGFTPKNEEVVEAIKEETALISKIINKYNK